MIMRLYDLVKPISQGFKLSACDWTTVVEPIGFLWGTAGRYDCSLKATTRVWKQLAAAQEVSKDAATEAIISELEFISVKSTLKVFSMEKMFLLFPSLAFG